jgi:ABC-2 type transport system permease protein
MTRLLFGELRKLRTTRLWLWMLLGACAVTAIFLSFLISLDGSQGNPNPPLSTVEGQRTMFSSVGAANVFVLILGIIAVTGEFRHQTVTPTFLATPHRGRVVIAKLVTYLVVGAAYGVVVMALALGIAGIWLSAKGIDLATGELPATVGAIVLSMAVYAVLGVGVGALIRNQIAAVVGALVYLNVVEAFLGVLPGVKDVYPYLPGGANNALIETGQPGVQGLNLLEPWQGGLLLVGYGVAFSVVGSWLAVRRDIT